MRALALGLLIMASPAMAADQFDLICTGVDRGKSENQRYRIDLERSEYCSGKCEQVRSIKEVTSGMIVLWDDKPSTLTADRSFNSINRNSGEWQWFYSSPRYAGVQDVKGRCEPTSFSGFPTRKF